MLAEWLKQKRRFWVVLAGVAFFVAVLSGCTLFKKSPVPTSQNPAAAVQMTDAEKAAFAAYYVDAAWLKENLANVVILDGRKALEYQLNHIPGALNVTWQSLSNMAPKQGQVGWGVVLPPEKLAEKLGSLGIDGSKMIVVYNNPDGLGEEGRLLWTLRSIGLENTRILNGGWPAWGAAGGEETRATPKVTPVQLTNIKPDPTLLATTEYVQTNKDKIKLLDVRSPEEYAGKDDHGEKQRWRIPGAIHLHFSDLYNADKTIKSIPELKATFQRLGLNPEDDIVSYCTVGIRSGFVTEILRMSGYSKAKNYNASFSEWTGLGLPVEK